MTDEVPKIKETRDLLNVASAFPAKMVASYNALAKWTHT